MKAISNIKTLIPIVKMGVQKAKEQGGNKLEKFKRDLTKQALPIFSDNPSLAQEYVEIITNEALSIDEIASKLLNIKI